MCIFGGDLIFFYILHQCLVYFFFPNEHILLLQTEETELFFKKCASVRGSGRYYWPKQVDFGTWQVHADTWKAQSTRVTADYRAEGIYSLAHLYPSLDASGHVSSCVMWK